MPLPSFTRRKHTLLSLLEKKKMKNATDMVEEVEEEEEVEMMIMKVEMMMSMKVEEEEEEEVEEVVMMIMKVEMVMIINGSYWRKKEKKNESKKEELRKKNKGKQEELTKKRQEKMDTVVKKLNAVKLATTVGAKTTAKAALRTYIAAIENNGKNVEKDVPTALNAMVSLKKNSVNILLDKSWNMLLMKFALMPVTMVIVKHNAVAALKKVVIAQIIVKKCAVTA